MERDLFVILENVVFIYLFQTGMPLYRKSVVIETKSWRVPYLKLLVKEEE